MNRIKQNAEILVDVCTHYDQNPQNKIKLREQILYLLTAIDKLRKENAK